jgi:hypothetical protein
VPLHPDDSPVRTIYAATRAGITPPAALDAFLGFLGDAAAEIGGRDRWPAARGHRGIASAASAGGRSIATAPSASW